MPEDDRLDVNGADTQEGSSEDGSTAVLQGLMSMLGEVLGRLDGRLGALEERLDDERGLDQREAVTLAALERLEHRLERVEAAATSGQDDGQAAVAAGFERLSRQLERLETRGAPAASVQAALSRLEEVAGAVDTIGYGLASLADGVTSTEPPQWVQGLQDTLEAVGGEVAELQRSLVQDPPGVQEALGRLDREVQVLRSQPGPGPALAMVAAGLAERFEERTDALVSSLQDNAAYSRRLWERVEELHDGRGFDELAVAEALEYIADRVESLTDSLEQSLPSGDGPAPRLDSVQTTLTTLVSTVERLRRGSEDLRGRVAALTASVDSLRVEGDVGTLPGSSGLGRRASEVGRRWASDLGLRGRDRERPGPSDEPETDA